MRFQVLQRGPVTTTKLAQRAGLIKNVIHQFFGFGRDGAPAKALKVGMKCSILGSKKEAKKVDCK